MFFGSAGIANIRLGVDEQGRAVLYYFDNDGSLLYNLGPDGIMKTPSQNERFEAMRVTVVRDEDGVRVRYFSQEDTVGPRMFSGCDRLRTLRLPKTTVSIQEQAFASCFCLELLYIPVAVHITSRAFEGTRPFLERLKE